MVGRAFSVGLDVVVVVVVVVSAVGGLYSKGSRVSIVPASKQYNS